MGVAKARKTEYNARMLFTLSFSLSFSARNRGMIIPEFALLGNSLTDSLTN